MSAENTGAGRGFIPANPAELQKHWKGFLFLGIISLILGSVAVLAPLMASLAITVVFGVILIINGVIQFIHCAQAKQTSSFFWSLLAGAVYVIAGGLVLARPLLGAVTLTLILAIFFIVEGVVKIGNAFKLKPAPNWGWLLFSGILPLILGIIIFSGWPGDTLWVLGLLLGIDLIFGGWSLIMLSTAAKRGDIKPA